MWGLKALACSAHRCIPEAVTNPKLYGFSTTGIRGRPAGSKLRRKGTLHPNEEHTRNANAYILTTHGCRQLMYDKSSDNNQGNQEK